MLRWSETRKHTEEYKKINNNFFSSEYMENNDHTRQHNFIWFYRISLQNTHHTRWRSTQDIKKIRRQILTESYATAVNFRSDHRENRMRTIDNRRWNLPVGVLYTRFFDCWEHETSHLHIQYMVTAPGKLIFRNYQGVRCAGARERENAAGTFLGKPMCQW